MKKNITINLCGRLFQIDEDAYEMLQHYIESLRASFGKEEGGEEIADDIEERIAELFEELKASGVEAITIDHVKDIITRIGEPEQLMGEDGEAKTDSNNGHRYDSFRSAAEGVYDNVRMRTAGKRLYRDTNNRMIAGVMSGFAAYTNTDVTWWRLGIVLSVLIYGFGILAYIVLAIVLPSAKTPEEQLQMQGREVTPQNLANVVVENGQMPVKRNGCLGAFVTALLVLFAVIVGLPLLVSLFLVVISFIVVFTVPTSVHLSLPFDIGFLELPELITLYPWAVITFMVGLLLTLLIPVYAIAHMFFSRANKIKPMGIGQRIFWVVLWVASLCGMLPSLIWIQQKNSERHHRDEIVAFQGVEMDKTDADYLRRGGWTLLKAENCAHYTYNGEYYNGDRDVRYLDAWNENCEEVYTADHREFVEPGIYRLTCLARAEGPGICIYALADQKHLQEIPAYGNTGGELIENLKAQNPNVVEEITHGPRITINLNGIELVFDDIQINSDDHTPSGVMKNRLKRQRQTQISNGYGWSVVTIDNIVVSNNSLSYGVSSDANLTERPCRAQWFSACDFKLEKIE